jgi:dTDP-6-deoxy-L-talose 4-dehydrogenase (NAD+)
MKKKILVTGANGYIGQHIVRILLDEGCDVIAADVRYDNVDPRAVRSNVPLFSDDEDIYRKFGEPDACIHAAWRDGFKHNAPSHMLDLSSHYRFIRNMVAGGLRQIIVMGTMHEVGYWEGEINDKTPTHPTSLYGVAKDALRKSVFEIQTEYPDLTVQWLRGFYIMGDDQKNHSIFTKIMEAEKEGKTEFPFTSGKNKYDFINVRDMSEDIAHVAMQTEIKGIINVCTGKAVSLGDEVESFIKEHDYKIKLAYGKFPDRAYDSPAVWGNAEKINMVRDMFSKENH